MTQTKKWSISIGFSADEIMKLEAFSDRELKPVRTMIRDILLKGIKDTEALEAVKAMRTTRPECHETIVIVIRVTKDEKEQILRTANSLEMSVNSFARKLLKYYGVL